MNLTLAPLSPAAPQPRGTSSDRKLVGALGLAATVGAGITLPYAHSLLRLGAIAPAELVGVLLEGGVLAGLAWAGLRMGRSLGLDAPLLRGVLGGRSPREHWALELAVSAMFGVALSTLVPFAALGLPLLLPATFSFPALPHVAAWQGLLGSIGAAIVEEILCRLFLMTALTWGLSKVFRSRSGAVFVAANVISAFVFGAMHVPQAHSLFGAVPPAALGLLLVGNGAIGIACGDLFRRKGIEHAMAAHLGADLFLHVAMTYV